MGQASKDKISTDGGRYDVTLSLRVRKSVYWDEPQSSIRRCTWFFKGDNENHFTPYEEDLSMKLEVNVKIKNSIESIQYNMNEDGHIQLLNSFLLKPDVYEIFG